LWLKPEEIVFKRAIYGYFDLVGDIGGVMEILEVVFGLLLLPISYHSFVIKATSKLFTAKTGDKTLFKPIKSEV
tara:strand:- start:544 stop:765 length:222 start_codon:yes stop_codon:yes gene_type:complete